VAGGTIVAVTLLAAVAIGIYVAISSLYFIGTDQQGRVALFRGVPYVLPFGVDLYSKAYTSGVSAASLPPARRDALLDHKLRSHDDATDLLRQLELGRLRPAAS
jgi:protein phosphatase